MYIPRQKFIVETVLRYKTKDNYTGSIVKIRENPEYSNPQPPNYKENNERRRSKRNISHRAVKK